MQREALACAGARALLDEAGIDHLAQPTQRRGIGHAHDEVKSITALVPASVETDWFQQNYGKADALTFLDKRVDFIGDSDNGASFPSVICTFGLENLTGEYVSQLRQFGMFYPKTESFLRQLVGRGNSPAQTLDRYFTEYSGQTVTEWADTRGVSPSAVHQNANATRSANAGESE